MGEEKYAMVGTRDWEAGRGRAGQRYSLLALDSDWHELVLPHLTPGLQPPGKAVSVRDEADSRPFTALVTGSTSVAPQPGQDVLDARGTFNRDEVKKELRRLSRQELEGKLGISTNKVEDILGRSERKTARVRGGEHKPGQIDYKIFLEVVSHYRLTSEQATTLSQAVRVFAYVEEFTCTPPTLVMLGLTLAELATYLYTSLYLHIEYNETISWTGPVPYCSALIYNPARRYELWRFISYMFVHIGISHFVFNMLMQVVVGVFLEMEQEGWLGSVKVLVVYLAGVVAGSLGTSLSDPSTYLAGASGGVYSLIAAHLATMALNWQEDGQVRIQKVVKRPITKIIRILFISILTIHDVAFAVYVRFYDPENRTGFMGHLCGAMAGLTVGLFVLDNRRVRSWEPYVQWISLVFFLAFSVFCVVWNVFGDEWSSGRFFPIPDYSNYTLGSCRDYRH